MIFSSKTLYHPKRSSKQNHSLTMFFLIAALLVGTALYPSTKFYNYDPVYNSMSLRLEKSELTVPVGGSCQIHCIAINQTIHFTSKKFQIASVTPGGKVYGIHTGTTIINVSSEKGSLSCTVHVVSSSK